MGINKKIIETEAQVTVEDAFNIVTYTGNSSTQSITGVGFQPDLIWIKSRNINGANHNLYDSTRGAGKVIFPNLLNSELTTADMTGFSSDGFNFTGAAYDSNTSGNNYVAWCWRANGGTTSSNTDGTITSTVQANQDAGFSIVKYGGNGVRGSTIGHGLSAAPEVIIVKNTSQAVHWGVYHQSIGNGAFLTLNSTAAATTSQNVWWYTNPSSTVFTVGNPGFNNDSSGIDYIAYCFAPVEGFSKFGSYTGNGTGSASNPIQDCGFRPDFVLLKNATDGGHWGIFDSARGGTGQNNKQLTAESSGAEYTGLDSTDYVKFEDTGFRATTSAAAYNGSGKTIIYMAFRIAS